MRVRRFLASCAVSCAAIALLLAAMGCGGGFSCPFTRPSCCDNAIFGCGPFDLPQGCSCNEYALRTFSGELKSSASKASQSPRAPRDETWRVALQKTSGNCSYLSNSVTSTVLIRTAGTRVQIRPIGYPTLRGTRSGRSTRVRGTQSVGMLRCQATLSGVISHISSPRGATSASIDMACQNSTLSCRATFTGSARKILP